MAIISLSPSLVTLCDHPGMVSIIFGLSAEALISKNSFVIIFLNANFALPFITRNFSTFEWW